MSAIRRSARAPAPRFKPFDYGPCPSGPLAQEKYFYAADGASEPIVNRAYAAGTEYTYVPENITALHFDPARWHNEPRPANYHGDWPPSSASQLLNTSLMFDDWEDPKAKQFRKIHGTQVYHECLGKYCWQNAGLPKEVYCQELNCSHSFSEWLTGAFGWEERFELRRIKHMGHGLYSKRNWEKGDILGAYLGELVPARSSNTDYSHEVWIGPAFEKTQAPVAYIDARHCGNYVRFCNHSCENNANISEGRVGEERVLVLRAGRRIAAGEQVTIDYQEDYFRGRSCLCGSARCKYTARSSGTAQTGFSMAAACDVDTSTRHDSVLRSESKFEFDSVTDMEM